MGQSPVPVRLARKRGRDALPLPDFDPVEPAIDGSTSGSRTARHLILLPGLLLRLTNLAASEAGNGQPNGQ